MNKQCLQECLRLIEEKLKWGPSNEWLNQEFQLLSYRIFEETRVRLSITTLKRVWGRVNYESDPSISTLNTLALFIGYENWNGLKQGLTKDLLSTPNIEKKKQWSKASIAAIIILLATSTLVLVAFNKESQKPFSAKEIEKVKFSSEPVTLGLPNSVVFKYDFADIEADSCFIQLSWNDQLTIPISNEGSEATAIYYYPGYFRAKLKANNQILKEHDVHIRTEGWMATIGGGEIPRYLYREELIENGSLKLTEATLREIYYTNTEEAPLLTYHYFNDFGEITGDSFEFETKFRNSYHKSNGICQKTVILVHGTEGVLYVSFSIPGCISDLNLFLMGTGFNGKTNDLSAFGTNLSEWQNLSCTVEKGLVNIYLNEHLIKTFETPYNLGQLLGFKYRFQGGGEIDYVKLSNANGVVFEDDFGNL
ncbi:MAG: hypothetical protein COW03_10280 [Cytophagales bacterium CG12_big_fil_rev_8_21_14_0_65_40_12]|nr:MAG: hypothetical protein COW03_10280 [Cytophagales bacterium CG12_big_fil_rev_8_21_14_0_65_40_12]PIW03872.1 MAG: hypothetical protein COW40_12760 [Cytophagales bacterium CG17_big_fil_post_rev_8_21_14_2_50_40_13]